MDTLTHYRHILTNVLRKYAQAPSHGEIRPEIVVNAEQTHYELMHVGWDGSRRVHGTVIHIDLVGDKVWVQHDGTSRGVALDLVEAGIPREAIILGFRPAHVRQYTGYGIA